MSSVVSQVGSLSPRLRRYLRRWRNGRPPGVLSAKYLRVRASPSMAVHRRTIVGSDRPGQATALLPAKVWWGMWWSLVGAPRSVERTHQLLAHDYEGSSDVGAAQQLSTLERLARRNSILPLDAYRLGLLEPVDRSRSDDDPSWAAFVFDHEIGWNLAASVMITQRSIPRRAAVRNARAQIAVLSDKHATAQRLDRVGLPTVDECVMPAQRLRGVDQVAAVAAQRWPSAGELFAKPRSGSAGRGGFVLTRRTGSGSAEEGAWQVSQYRSTAGDATRSAVAALLDEMASQHYLIQPRLTTADQWADVATDSDVVTLRVVTRDVGAGPKVFSRAIEVPLPPLDQHTIYLVAGVAGDGIVDQLAVPAYAVAGLRSEATQVWQRLEGRIVAQMPEIDEMTKRAHELFPGVFAVAWDLALTDEGPVFLEGNTGFGTLTPQMVSGGLLSD